MNPFRRHVFDTLALCRPQRSYPARTVRPVLRGKRGGQAAAGARHCGALQHEFAAVGVARIQPAGARRRYRARHPAAARQHRRAHQLRASPRAVLEGQCQLRCVGLCRAIRPGVAVWPRRPRLWLGADHRRAGGQGANRFTARIHGETEASATIEASAHPQLGQDWSLDLNFSDGFRWSEPPVLRVMGHEIPLAKYAEPRIRSELGTVRSHALAAARRLDLRDKAATAWRHAFEPIQLSDSPAIWLQMTPQSVSFAGMQASSRTLRGSIELSGAAQTVIGQNPPVVAATELPPLGASVNAPGAFDIILPVRIGYDVLKDRLMQAAQAMPPVAGLTVRDVDIYPSSGKLVVGLRVAGAGGDAGKWVYLSGAVEADAGGRMIRLSSLDVIGNDEGTSALVEPIAAQIRAKLNVDYGLAYDNLLNAANAKLNRKLEDGFRMEGHLGSAGPCERVAAREWRGDRGPCQRRAEDPLRHVTHETIEPRKRP